MTAASLTIVLPAYNEEARLGPALDELFGYLRRHGEQGRDGAPGAARLPDDVRVLVVDDGSTDGTADLVRARPETAADDVAGAPLLALLAVPHGGKGAAVKAGMLAAETDLVDLRRRRHGHPAGPAAAPRRGAPRPRPRPRQPDPARRQRHAADASPASGGSWAGPSTGSPRSGRSATSRTPSAASRASPARRPTTSSASSGSRSIVFDVELIYLARRRGYRIAVVPIVWSDKHGSRMHPGPRLGLRVAWDLFRTPFLHRRVARRR